MPLIYVHKEKSYPDLVVIGKPWFPRAEDRDSVEADIDEILEINYD